MAERPSPLKSIRHYCLGCSGTPNEVKLCPFIQCALYPYRLGHSPNRARKPLTPEERENIRKRFARKNLPVSTGEIHEGIEISAEGDPHR